MDANITLIGNVGTDIELTSGDSWSFAKFRLACTPRIRRGTEWVDGQTTWINVRCRGRLADNVTESLHKGDPVVVTGKLRTNAWTTDGERHEQLQVVADSIGHDLRRGTTVFAKPLRAISQPGTVVDEPDDVNEEDEVDMGYQLAS